MLAELFAGSTVDAVVVSRTSATPPPSRWRTPRGRREARHLLLAIRDLARAEDVESTLLEEWRTSLPELEEASERAARSAASKGWRWVGEMEEIASTFAAADLPEGFHRAAAEVFRRSDSGRP